MRRRPSRPEEEPPRRQGGRGAWLVGSVPGAVALALLVIVVIVLVVVLVS